jgi:hypothetical protein
VVQVNAVQFRAEGQGAAGMAFELKVAQLLGNILELILRVLNPDYCVVEALSVFTVHYRHFI